MAGHDSDMASVHASVRSRGSASYASNITNSILGSFATSASAAGGIRGREQRGRVEKVEWRAPAAAGIGWLRSAEDECALDVEGFAPMLPEVTKRTREVVQEKYAQQPQGLQASMELLGEEWARTIFPDKPNDPSVLREPFLSRRDRNIVLSEVETDLVSVLEDLPGQDQYKTSVDETMRRCLIRQLQSAPMTDVAQLRGQVRESLGDALGVLWSQHPEMEERELPRMRGMPLPSTLRKHVYLKRLGGEEGAHRCKKNLERMASKTGGAGGVEGQREAILRVVSEVLASNRAMHSLDLPLQTLVNVLLRASQVAQHSLRLERQVMLLAPLYVVFRLGTGSKEEGYIRLVSMLLELQEQLPDPSLIPATASRIIENLKENHLYIFSVLKKLCQPYKERKQRKETLEEAMGQLVRPWLLSAFSGTLGVHSLLWAWDQMIVRGWGLLEDACLQLLVLLEGVWERAADWEECLTAAMESPRSFTPHQLKILFPA